MKNLFDKTLTYLILWFLAFVTMLAIILTAPIAWYIDRCFLRVPNRKFQCPHCGNKMPANDFRIVSGKEMVCSLCLLEMHGK